MKKLLFLSAVLLGVIPASQAGIHLGFGIELPLPLPPPLIIGHPRRVVVQPSCEAGGPVVVAPGYDPYYYPSGRGYIVHRGGWERYGRYHGYRGCR